MRRTEDSGIGYAMRNSRGEVTMKGKKAVPKHMNIALLLLMIGVAAVTTRGFFTVRNFFNIVQQMSMLGLLALGMTFVILSGHMDLSVGATMTFTGLIAISFQNYLPVGLAIICALLVGCLIGMLNGVIVVMTKANSGESLMITFGMQLLLYGMSLVYTKGFALSGSNSVFFNSIGTGKLFSFLPIPIAILITFAAMLSFVEAKTTFGRSLHMIGYNSEASRLSGMNIPLLKIACYAMSGLMAAFGAIILSSRTLGATPTAGDGYEMDAIIAIVLGGTSLSGGAGSVLNTFVGILTLGLLGNIMNLLGFVSFDQMIVKGIILILAVYADVINRKQLLRA